MKKSILMLGFLALGSTAVFAQKYMTRTAKVTFDATTSSSPEKITAKNNEVAALLNAATGDVVFQVKIGAFKF